MRIQGMTDTEYRRIHMLLVAERRRIKRRVNSLIATECNGIGFGI